MTAAMITSLLIQFGPSAIVWIEDLVALWEKPTITVADIQVFMAKAKTPYADYIAAAKAAAGK